MHRNRHLDPAFSLLSGRCLGRMNAADRPPKGLVDSQTSDVDSTPIARSINPDDSVHLTRLSSLNSTQNPTVLDGTFGSSSVVVFTTQLALMASAV